MADVEIPFSDEMAIAAVEGRKGCTSRNKRYGAAGDRFTVRGTAFEIIDVFEADLGDVAALLFREEGFQEKQGFVDIWERLHPRKGFIPSQKVFVHRFRKVTV